MSSRSAIIFIFWFFYTLYPPVSFSNDYDISNIVLAKNAGIWKKNGEYGYFKVIVYRVGLEHPADKVRVLITKVDIKNNSQKIINEFPLNSPGIKGYISDLSLKVVNNRLSIGLNIEMKAMDGIILRETLLVDTKGNVNLLSPAKYIDIYELE